MFLGFCTPPIVSTVKKVLLSFVHLYITFIYLTLDTLILALNNTKKRKKYLLQWYCPNCAMKIPLSALRNKIIKTVVLGVSSKTS